MSLSMPRTIANRYEIDRPIGDGAFSRTFLATDNVLERRVAIKLLRKEFISDPDLLARFEREAHAAARISHPNIVSVFDVGVQGDRPYIVMEFVDGPTLKEYLRDAGPLTIEEAIDISRQLLDGLAAAHEVGVIHRDVKPQNILLDENRVVKLADFGVAFITHKAGLTSTGSALGTAAYMAPEQASGHAIGPPADLYAVGVILYEMLTGRLPFLGDNPVQLMYRHVSELPPAPRQFNRRITMPTEAVVLRALAKVPSDRYPDARSMRRALLDASPGLIPVTDSGALTISDRSQTFSGPTRQNTPPTPPPPPTRRAPTHDHSDGRGWPILAIAAVLVLLAVLAGYTVVDSLGLFDSSDPPSNEAQAGFPTDPTASPTATTPSPTATEPSTEPAGISPEETEPPVEATEPPANTPAPTTEATSTDEAMPEDDQGEDEDENDTNGDDQPADRFNQPRDASAISIGAPGSYSATFGRDDLVAGGAYRRDDGVLYDRPTAHLYGQGTPYASTTITFDAFELPSSSIILRIVGLDDELSEHPTMRLSINGNVIWTGPSPFANEEWTAKAWLLGNLNWIQQGENTLTIELLDEGGELGQPPWILINEVQIAWN